MSVTELDSTQAFRLQLATPADVDPLTGTISVTPENLLASGVAASFSELEVTGSVLAADVSTTGGLDVGGGINVANGVAINAGGLIVKGILDISTNVYADNAAAIAGGLTRGQAYRTSTGVVMVVFVP